MLLKIDSINDLPEAADAILEALNGRSIVAFWGEMGAGKTTLIRIINRITAPGRMSAPLPGEAHDGEYPLRRYLRAVDIADR